MRISITLSGLPTTLRGRSRADDVQQPTDKVGAVCFILVCLHALFFGYVAVAHYPIYDFLRMGEGAVDFLTFAIFLLAGVVLFAAALAERRLLPRCAYVLGSIILLFFAGEESSWGQHITGFETPNFMVDLNVQKEFNIHNIKAVEAVYRRAARYGIFILCLAACVAFLARKNRILGIPSPPITITLAFLVMTSYFYMIYGRISFNFEDLILFVHRGLFLLLLMVSMNARLFIATVAALSVALCTDYVTRHHWSHHATYLASSEFGEYLFSVCCFFYALRALLDQRAAGQKIASSIAALKSAAALPSIRIKSSPPPRLFRAANRSRNYLTPWTGICALIIAGSIGLALITHLHYRADVTAFQETMLLIRTAGAAARSNFDVYIDGRELRYFKQPCVHRPDLRSTFFLGVFPQDVDDLPVERRPYGFENIEFQLGQYGWILDGACAATVRLPSYQIASVSTGQYTWEDGAPTNLWIAEFPVNKYKAAAAAFQETLSLTRTVEPAARSNFDVYIDRRELRYFKQPCGYADVSATFFLGVFPQNVNVLPVEQRQRGFQNLDFDFRQYGGVLDDACAATVRLPDYEIARVSTGQYTWDSDGVPTNLWIAEFPVNK